jgi:hypothetical protein
VETAEVLVRKPHDSTEAMEFIGRTSQAVFAAASDWLAYRLEQQGLLDWKSLLCG